MDPWVAYLLVVVGTMGLVLEFKSPGLIAPAVLAIVCFALVFALLGGPLVALGVFLFVLGLALLGAELVFVPGHGAGVSGALLLLVGLVCAGMDGVPDTTDAWAAAAEKLLYYCMSMAGAGAAAIGLSRYLPDTPYANQLVLIPPDDQPDADLLLPAEHAALALLGQVGTTTTLLGLAGRAQIGGWRVDVMTVGTMIPAGTAVRVVEVEGTRVVVKRV